MDSAIHPGTNIRPGAVVERSGITFCVFADGATAIELVLFESEHSERPSRRIPLTLGTPDSARYWQLIVSGLKAGQTCGFRAAGPYERGWRFNPQKLLLDPYGLAVAVSSTYRKAAGSPAKPRAPR